MGFCGIAINGVKGVIGLLTNNGDMIDSAIENGQKSLRSFLYDPIGVSDVAEEIAEEIAENF